MGIDSFDMGLDLGKGIAARVLPATREEATLHPSTDHLLGVIRKLGRE